MATNTIKTRIKHKIGTAAEWQTAATNSQFKPLEGELIVYESATTPMLKVGDGSSLVTALPFVGGNPIASITRSGTTFTATHIDGTTSTFTQQDNNTTYSPATTSTAGLMSAADKTKLDGIATGATKITVDSALSSTSTNPVQNKVVNTAISNLNTLVGDTSVATQIANATADMLTIDTTDSDAGTVPRTNSDLLGGKPLEYFAHSVNGKTPDSAGNVALTASDIGALASGGTAANSSKLNGQVASYYASKTDVSSLTASDVGAAAIAFYTLSFPVSGWVLGSDGAYTQQVAVSGLTQNNNGHVDIDMSSATVNTAADLQDAWAMVGRAQSIAGALKLTCFDGAPEIDISVKLEVIT